MHSRSPGPASGSLHQWFNPAWLLLVPTPLPVFEQLLVVKLGLFQSQMQRPARQMSFQDLQPLDVDGCLELAVDGVEMGWPMIAKEHPDHDSVENTDRRHPFLSMIAKSGRRGRVAQMENRP
jgi:hypothetical protein